MDRIFSSAPRHLPCWRWLCVLLLIPWQAVWGQWQPSGLLEVHYINVGQGGCTLIIAPNGQRILFDFGARSGNRDIVPYLRDTLGLPPEEGIHYAIVSHRDRDHYVGYKDVVTEGYDIIIANYGPGSPRKVTKFIRDQWLKPAEGTTAGAVRPIPVGLRISLGAGAEAIVMAANGVVLGEPQRRKRIPNENDRSIALFIHYKKFQYILDGDLGAGPEDCTHHDTSQRNVQGRVAEALLREGLITEEHGVDVLHIAHHGSESSTSCAYFQRMKPEVGLVSVGLNQGSFLHPRADVVDGVLLDQPLSSGAPTPAVQRAQCVVDSNVAALRALYQTEEGVKDCSSTGCTSFSGLPVGDIKLTTDGKSGYIISATGRVHEGSKGQALEPTCFDFDEGGGCQSPD